MAAVAVELFGAGFDQHFFALLGEALTFGKIRGAGEHERGAGFDRAQMALAQFALRHQQQARLACRGAQKRCALFWRALLERGTAPAQPGEQALGGNLRVPREIVPLAVFFDPRVDQFAMKPCADGPTAARSTSQEKE